MKTIIDFGRRSTMSWPDLATASAPQGTRALTEMPVVVDPAMPDDTWALVGERETVIVCRGVAVVMKRPEPRRDYGPEGRHG
jgi:hypothetical protein